ncbi:MAG TPA: M48 family metallopeptidase [Candidatus Acidoferrum sp.]|nr:M48 family metallopeptidase [Candidatus Acidoferrum sp.]
MKTLPVSLALFAIAILCPLSGRAAPLAHLAQGSAAAPAVNAEPVPASQQTEKKVTEYTLPPDLYRKAHTLAQIAFWGQLSSILYSWVILWLVLGWKLGPKYREWAERGGSARFLQAWIFAPPLLLSLAVLNIPFDIAQQSVLRKFGISIQGWGSWSWDWTKGEIISLILGTLLVWLLYAEIRKSPRRWWFYFWLVSLPILVLLVFLQPLVIDPLFHKFEPLAQKDPALTVSLETMVQRAGQNIPPERMYWMNAGEKLTALNAYVTGIGASKRMVVWDTTIAKMTTPQIVFVAGHEMGHYVLNHIWKGLAFGAVGLLILFYLGFRTVGWVLARWGGKWGIRGLDDWASLPALLLLVAVFSFIGSPIGSAFSRYVEHQADQYGLEVTHGLTPDSSQVAAQSFQILGEVDLSDPAPNPVDVFLFYSHPPIPDRVRYALTYDPWDHGEQPEFVK